MTSYKVTFNGSNEDVEQMIKIMDKLFRRWYNVYGGKRESSWRDSNGYHVVVIFTADWSNWWIGFNEIYVGAMKTIAHMHWISEDSYCTRERTA